MSAYSIGYEIRYTVNSVQHQAEVAVVTAADQIKNEDAGTPDHANRYRWAVWIDTNSLPGMWPFMWPIAMNPSIQAAYANDPTGGSIPDGDIQFIVNSNLDYVISRWVIEYPAATV
jgi:hypothetical protein